MSSHAQENAQVRADARAERAQPQAFRDVRDGAHGIFTVGGDGSVNQTRQDVMISRAGGALSPTDVIRQSGEHFLSKAETKVGDITISDKSKADWPRMDFTFKTPDGDYNTKHTGSSNTANEKIAESVAVARQFAGTDQATKVLSSVLNQYGWRDLTSSIAAEDGTQVNFRPLPRGTPFADVHTPDGVIRNESPTKQITGAHFVASKTEDGNFKITMDWTIVSNGPSEGGGFAKINSFHSENPTSSSAGDISGAQSALSVTVTGEIIISAEAAHRGELDITSGAFEHTFQGKVFG